MSKLIRILFSVGFSIILYSIVIHAEVTNRDGCESYLTKRYLGKLHNLLEDFKKICSRYPTKKEGLSAFYQEPEELKCKFEVKSAPWKLVGGEELSIYDGWNKKFTYTTDGKAYRIESTKGYFVTNSSPHDKWDFYWEIKGKEPKGKTIQECMALSEFKE